MNALELEKSATFQNVLVATDFSDASTHALKWAAAITEANDAHLVVVHAVASDPHLPIPLDTLPLSLDRDLAAAQRNMQTLVSGQLSANLSHEEILERGSVADVVEDVLQQKSIDLLIVATHGRTGLKKVVLGSLAEELFRRASCPVLTVGPGVAPIQPIRRVLFATDFGPSSVQALPYAVDFANQYGGELTLLNLRPPLPVDYVGPLWYPGDNVVETEEALRRESLKVLHNLLPSNSRLKCSVEHVVEFHYAPEGIINFAAQWDADLIVMGVKKSSAEGARFAAHIPWATAHTVVSSARCPVLTVRA
jgi:nucleotide-binding universal stress UspA family protein